MKPALLLLIALFLVLTAHVREKDTPQTIVPTDQPAANAGTAEYK